MITYLRNNATVVLWIIVFAFIIGLLPAAYKQLTDTAIWAVKVNGEQIGYKEFQFERLRQRDRILAFRRQYGEYADWLLRMMNMSDPQMLAVRSVARQELMNQLADAVGVYVSEEYVAQRLNDQAFVARELSELMPPQLVDPATGLDQKMLSRYLKQLGLTTDVFERLIERQLAEKMMNEIIYSASYVPEFDIKSKYLSKHAKKSFSVLQFSLDKLVEEQKKKAVSDAQLEAFYAEQNKQSDRYVVPEKRAGTIWTFSPKNYDISISDARIEAYYEKNKVAKYLDKPATVTVKHILLAVSDPSERIAQQEQAAHIKDELIRDASQFEELAKRYSGDKESASRGGMLKPFARGEHEASFDKAAFILQNDGDISDVIETARGFEIIQRVAKTPQSFKPLSMVDGQIRAELKEKAFESHFAADMKAVIDNDQTLKEFIAQKGGTPKAVKDVALDGSALSEHLFKLKKGEKTFFIDGENGVAVRLDSIAQSYTPSFDILKKTVLQDYYTYNAEQELKHKLQDAKARLAGTTLKEFQKDFDGKVIQTGWLEPEKEHDSLKKDGIPVERMLQMEKIGSLITQGGPNGGFLVRLDQIEPFNQDDFGQKRGEILKELEAERGQQLLEGFVASLYRNATIDTNESVITLQA